MSYWSETYKRYSPEVLAFLQRRLWGRREEAEDLCQETFARALGTSSELRDPTKARPYLLRIANNLLISHVRRGNRVVAESDLGFETEMTARVDPNAADPLELTGQTELEQKVKELLSELPEDKRLAFEHGVIERRPYSQIAEEQNWSITKVKVNVYRARKHLMAGLQDYRQTGETGEAEARRHRR